MNYAETCQLLGSDELMIYIVVALAFSALTLLLGRLARHPA